MTRLIVAGLLLAPWGLIAWLLFYVARQARRAR